MEAPPAEDSGTKNNHPRYEVTGRTVFFKEPGTKNFAWGIELDIPIDPNLRESFVNYSSNVLLPDNITHIRMLVLNPEEALPPEQRVMELPEYTEPDLFIDNIVNQGPDVYGTAKEESEDTRKSELIFRIRSVLSCEGENNVELFNSTLKNAKGNTLLIIGGHGGGSPWVMGEQSSTQPVDAAGKPIASWANSVKVEDVLNKYDDPLKYGAIIIHACNAEEMKLKSRKVPIFYSRSKIEFGGIYSSKIGYTPAKVNEQRINYLKRLFRPKD